MKKILLSFFSLLMVFVLLTGCQSGTRTSSNVLNEPGSRESFGSEGGNPSPTALPTKKYSEKIALDGAITEDAENDVREEGNQNIDSLEQKIIKTGRMSFEVDDIPQSQNFINEQLKTFEGYVAHSDDRENYSTLTLKVPSKNFDSLVSALLQGVKELEYKNIDTTDVSEEFYDVTARLKTKKELETHYLLILDKATKVEDILAVERELNIVRSDIESMEGRLRYLNNNIDLSTLTITLNHSKVDSVIWSKEFSLALGNGLQGLIWFGVGLVTIWPVTVLFLVILFFVIRKIRRVLRKSKKIIE